MRPRIVDQLREATGYGWSYNQPLGQWDSEDGSVCVRRVAMLTREDEYTTVYVMYGRDGKAEDVGVRGWIFRIPGWAT